MKTLHNQTLIYDADCPLCSIYTTGFVKVGMLDQSGKKAFSDIAEQELNIIDRNRASNEIALIDYKHGTVVYEIDSLLKIIGHSIPIIEKMGHFYPINYILKKLYSFISYNRKVIIPSTLKPDTAISCIPDFNIKYRLLYITFAIVLTASTLFAYAKILPIPEGSIWREIALATGQILFQSFFLTKVNKKTVVEYIGNLMTVSLLGALLLLPIIILNNLILVNEISILVWFGITVAIMFTEHYRRINLLKLPTYLCWTWVLYRILALLLLLTI